MMIRRIFTSIRSTIWIIRLTQNVSLWLTSRLIIRLSIKYSHYKQISIIFRLLFTLCIVKNWTKNKSIIFGSNCCEYHRRYDKMFILFKFLLLTFEFDAIFLRFLLFICYMFPCREIPVNDRQVVRDSLHSISGEFV